MSQREMLMVRDAYSAQVALLERLLPFIAAVEETSA